MPNLSNASSLRDVVAFAINIISLIVPVLVALIVVIFMWFGVKYVYSADSAESKNSSREALVWGLVALFVVMSVWGILRFTCDTLLGSSSCSSGNAGGATGAPLNIVPPSAR
jgi:hypothetical protein